MGCFDLSYDKKKWQASADSYERPLSIKCGECLDGQGNCYLLCSVELVF